MTNQQTTNALLTAIVYILLYVFIPVLFWIIVIGQVLLIIGLKLFCKAIDNLTQPKQVD